MELDDDYSKVFFIELFDCFLLLLLVSLFKIFSF